MGNTAHGKSSTTTYNLINDWLFYFKCWLYGNFSLQVAAQRSGSDSLVQHDDARRLLGCSLARRVRTHGVRSLLLAQVFHCSRCRAHEDLATSSQDVAGIKKWLPIIEVIIIYMCIHVCVGCWSLQTHDPVHCGSDKMQSRRVGAVGLLSGGEPLQHRSTQCCCDRNVDADSHSLRLDHRSCT